MQKTYSKDDKHHPESYTFSKLLEGCDGTEKSKLLKGRLGLLLYSEFSDRAQFRGEKCKEQPFQGLNG